MRTRQKLRRYTILLLLLVFTGTTLSSAINPGLASAAPYSSDSVQDKAKAWILARAVSMCFAQESLDNNNFGDDQIDETHAYEGGWFEDEVGRDEGRQIGEWAADLAEGDSDDAKATCRTSDLVPVTLEALGWNNDAEGNTDALCSMGIWYRQAGDDCKDGAGWFKTSKDKGGERSGAWSNAVRAKYFEGKGIEASLTPGMRYWILRESFIQECGDGEGAGLSISPYTDQNANSDREYIIDNWFNGTELEKSYIAAVEHNHTHSVRIGGYGLFTSDDVYQCKTIADKMDDYADDFAKEGGVESGLGSSSNGTNGASLSNSCAGSNFTGVTNLNWLFCPFIELTLSAAEKLEDQISGMLCINESEIFGRNANITCNGTRADASVGQAFKEAWNVFRILAIGLLAIAGLVMVLSQALGFELVDAYTIKRTLPRILIAAIGISLSWQLLQFLVTLSNALGIGVRSLIYAPFAAANIEIDVLNGGAMAVGALFAAGGLVTLGVLGVLSFLLTGALAILIAFFILVIRNILVILLILVAPVAIAMYILPNTEKYYKFWWEWLFKALMAFPIITAMIAVGHVFAAIASTRSDSTFSAIVAFLAYFAPYFLIPAAFRFAGGALATIGGFANNSSRGGFDRLKKFREGQSTKHMRQMKDGNRYAGSRFVPGSRTAAKAFNRTTVGVGTGASGRFGLGGRGAEAVDQQRRNAADELRKSAAFNAIKDDDHALRAATYDNYSDARRGMQEYFVKSGQSQADALASADRAVNSARASIGFGRPQAIAAAQQLVDTGTGYDNMEDMVGVLNRASGDNTSTQNGLAGYANARTKSVGRHDLAPGYGELSSLVRGDGGSIDTAKTKAWKSASLYQHANDKPQNIKAAISHHKKMLDDGMANNDHAKMEQAAVFFNELKSMQPNAGGDVGDAINTVLSDSPDGVGRKLNEVLESRLPATAHSPATNRTQAVTDNTGKMVRDPATGNPMTVSVQETGRQRVQRLARAYERPDPNHDS